MEEVFEVQCLKSLKWDESNLGLEHEKVFKKMEKALKVCNDGVHHEVANSPVMFFQNSAGIPNLEALPHEKAINGCPTKVNEERGGLPDL